MKINDWKKYPPILKAFVLYIAAVSFAIGMGLILIHTNIFVGFDRYFYELINGHHFALMNRLVFPINFNFIKFGVTPSYLNFFVVGLLIYLLIKDRKEAVNAIMMLVFGSLLSISSVFSNTILIFRQRPFTVFPAVVDPVYQKIWLGITSWPSGHVRDTTMVCVIISFFIPKLRIPLALFVLFVAYSRVYAGAHYPTDAIGGIIVGILIALIVRELVTSINSSKWYKRLKNVFVSSESK